MDVCNPMLCPVRGYYLGLDSRFQGQLHLLLGDVSLRADVIRIMAEFREKEKKLDALVCNAGM